MGILDDLNKTVTGSVGWMKFEARKLQKTTRIQSEIFDLRQQRETTIAKLGQRALELYQQGLLTLPGVAELAQTVDQLQNQIAAKEQELQQAQAEAYVEPSPPASAQHVPIQPETAAPAPPSDTSAGVACPRCGFICPPTALFCANCGTRVAP